MTKIKPPGDVHDTGPHVVPSGKPRESTALGGGSTGSAGTCGGAGATGGGSTRIGSVVTGSSYTRGAAGADATTLGGTRGGVSTVVGGEDKVEDVTGVEVPDEDEVEAEVEVDAEGASNAASSVPELHPVVTQIETASKRNAC